MLTPRPTAPTIELDAGFVILVTGHHEAYPMALRGAWQRGKARASTLKPLHMQSSVNMVHGLTISSFNTPHRTIRGSVDSFQRSASSCVVPVAGSISGSIRTHATTNSGGKARYEMLAKQFHVKCHPSYQTPL
jgi:hypothetical protein